MRRVSLWAGVLPSVLVIAFLARAVIWWTDSRGFETPCPVCGTTFTGREWSRSGYPSVADEAVTDWKVNGFTAHAVCPECGRFVGKICHAGDGVYPATSGFLVVQREKLVAVRWK